MLVPSRLRAGRLATKVSVALRRLARRPALLVLCLSLSILVQTLFVGLNVALARGCGLDLPVAAWLFAWPLAKLIAIVPISLAGLGVREASLVGLMAPFGADSATVVAVGLLWQSILFATGAIGGLVLLLTSGPRGAGAPPVAAVERLRSRP
jgi:uncharacterized membrane protein YbhN (UPF0104 family)